MEKEALIIFAKTPKLGFVKSRLAIDLGAVKALEIYKNLLVLVENYTKDIYIQKKVYWEGDVGARQGFENGYINLPQSSGTLGEKMRHAFADTFTDADLVCIIGSDCAELTSDIVKDAFHALRQGKDIVIGPAFDGGYYLLGMRKLNADLFLDIDWGTDSVFSETIKKAKRLQLSLATLQTLHDVDTARDYFLMKEQKLIR